jgi:hypothetical protein
MNDVPAFPVLIVDRPEELTHFNGMTLREYAAIKLKVPDSGTDWLDDMIRKSNDIDMMLLTSQQQSNTL